MLGILDDKSACVPDKLALVVDHVKEITIKINFIYIEYIHL